MEATAIETDEKGPENKGSDKDMGRRKDSADQEERGKKSEYYRVSEATEEERCYSLGGRGHGRGQGDRGTYRSDFGGAAVSPTSAPSIEDPGQLPTLGGKWITSGTISCTCSVLLDHSSMKYVHAPSDLFGFTLVPLHDNKNEQNPMACSQSRVVAHLHYLPIYTCVPQKGSTLPIETLKPHPCTLENIHIT
ncbi:hypothetical protein C4D60_Mb06t02540 [Musa balbisiana]|uniref:Uncharacterized protein n=1 Tax=Musa balbisiana TaxID=52838 RepID=A0A4S8IMJ4_MUSBA|nr:hypothetical protein C4D60_Mb06t02540 [Musa balbisiana]